MRWTAAILLLVSGCLSEAPTEADYAVSGNFTADRTQADVDDFFVRVEAWGGDGVLMESFPEQFRVTLLETDGYLFVQEIEDLPYVANVGVCQAM